MRDTLDGKVTGNNSSTLIPQPLGVAHSYSHAKLIAESSWLDCVMEALGRGDQGVTNPVLCVRSIGKTPFHFPTGFHVKLISVFTPAVTLVLQL